MIRPDGLPANLELPSNPAGWIVVQPRPRYDDERSDAARVQEALDMVDTLTVMLDAQGWNVSLAVAGSSWARVANDA